MFAHWMSITARRDAESGNEAGPFEKSITVPDPPNYTVCVDSLASEAGATPNRSNLKQQCEQRYTALKEQVLESLITAEWFFAEGEVRGLRVSTGEEAQRVKQVRQNGFRTEAEYEAYLHRGGETQADQLFRSRIKLFSAKLQQQIEGSGSAEERRRTLYGYMAHFGGRWSTKTDCRRGFVVPGCSQYKGPIRAEPHLL